MTTNTKPALDALAFFEHVALKGLGGKEFRMPAAQQREFFGYVPFGKKRIMVKGPKVQTVWKVSYGSDWETYSATWSQADKQWRCAHDGRLLGLTKFHR